MAHGENEDREGQGRANPKPAGHVAQLAIVLRLDGHGLRFQRHAALGTRPGVILLDLRVHWAGINDLQEDAGATTADSKAMPHFGHVPGRSLSTPGHMGQKYADVPEDVLAAGPP